MIIIMTIKGKSLGNICFKSPGMQRELGVYNFLNFFLADFLAEILAKMFATKICNIKSKHRPL